MGLGGKDDGAERRGYHHGNLREALMRAAIDVIADKGLSAFTIAEAARAAGVSPAAPYRHYRDRDALLADLACAGFEDFERVLRRAWSNAEPSPTSALRNVARAYLDFARSEAARFAVMFEAGISPSAHPEVREAARFAFAVMRDASQSVVDSMPSDRRPPATMMALHVWSQTHGIAVLHSDAGAAGQLAPISAADLLDAGILIYLAGLGRGAG